MKEVRQLEGEASKKIATSAMEGDDTTTDHPVFDKPIVKGTRTARSKLSVADHNYYKRHIEERMAELRDTLINKKAGSGLNIAAETRKLVEELETLDTPSR